MRTSDTHRARSGRCIQLALVLLAWAINVAHAGQAAPDTRLPLEFTSRGAPGNTYARGANLQELIAEALQNNPEIRAARKELEAAENRISPAGALDDPMLEAGFLNVPVNTLSLSREDMTMKMLGLSQRFPYPGKRTLRQNVAEQGAASLEHAYRETVNRVARDAKLAYYDLVLVVDSTRLVEQNRAILLQLLKVADSRYSVGQGNQVDVLRAQTQLSRMNEELLKLGRDRPMFEAELIRLLGRVSANGGSGPNPLGPLVLAAGLREVSIPFEALREKAVRDRPQLLGLQAIIAKNERTVELARKDRYPDFDVKFSYGQRDNMPDGARRSDMVSLTVAMNLPVWRQTKTLPRIAEALAMQEQAREVYEAQRNETTMKLRQQVAAAEQNLRAAKLYESEILPQSRLTVEAAVAAYQVARSDFALLLDNQMAVLNFEIARATATVNYNKALAEIAFLAGEDALAESAAATGNKP